MPSNTIASSPWIRRRTSIKVERTFISLACVDYKIWLKSLLLGDDIVEIVHLAELECEICVIFVMRLRFCVLSLFGCRLKLWSGGSSIVVFSKNFYDLYFSVKV
jgi:hypothetical protein